MKKKYKSWKTTMTKEDYDFNKREQLVTIHFYRKKLGWSFDKLYSWAKSKGYKRYLKGNSIEQLQKMRAELQMILSEITITKEKERLKSVKIILLNTINNIYTRMGKDLGWFDLQQFQTENKIDSDTCFILVKELIQEGKLESNLIDENISRFDAIIKPT